MEVPTFEILPDLRSLKRETTIVLRKTNLYKEIEKMVTLEGYRKVDLKIFLNMCINDVYIGIEN